MNRALRIATSATLQFLFALMCTEPLLAQSPVQNDCNMNFRSDVIDLDTGFSADCNRDGLPDECSLFPKGYRFSQGDQSSVELGTGNLLATGRIADLNNDGAFDVVGVFGTSSSGPGGAPFEVKIFLNSGNDTFDTESLLGTFPESNLELVQGEHGIDLFLSGDYYVNDGSANFSIGTPPSAAPSGTRADLNGDGLEDLVVYHLNQSVTPNVHNLSYRLAIDSSSFADPVTFFSGTAENFSWKVQESDGNSRDDVLILDQQSSKVVFQLYLSNAMGVPTLETTFEVPDQNAANFHFAKLNDNALSDIIFSAGNRFYRILDYSLLNGLVIPELAGYSPCAIQRIIDLNNDGFDDAICTKQHVPTLCCRSVYQLYFLNDSQGNLQLASTEAYYSTGNSFPQSPSDTLFVDLNSDQLPDEITLFSSGTLINRSLSITFTRQGVSEVSPASELDENNNLVPDSCESGEFTNSRYSLWNSFLGLINIAELANNNDEPALVQLSMRDISGNFAHSLTFQLAARQQFDVILNELPTFVDASYGVVEIASTKEISANLSYYKNTSPESRVLARFDTGEYDFAYQLPFLKPKYSKTELLFNSYQPSAYPADSTKKVANWITIVNLSNSPQSYEVRSYFEAQSQPLSRTYTLNEFGRIDVDGGHGLNASFSRGFHEVEPLTPGAAFLALLTRYGTTFDANRFAFAFPAFDASASPLISTGGGAHTWLEVANPTSQVKIINVYISDSNGLNTSVRELPLAAHGVSHFLVNSWIGTNATGSIRLQDLAGLPGFHAQSVSYFYSPRTGAIETAFLQRSRGVKSESQTVSYNRFLGMYNWLQFLQTDELENTLTLSTFTPGTSESTSELQFFAGPGQVLEFDIHNDLRFGTHPDSYGLVEIAGEMETDFLIGILRVKPTSSGGFDFIMQSLP